MKEIEQTRERLSGNIRKLEESLPSPARMAKRLAGLAVGGGAGSGVALLVIKRVRKRRRERKRPAPVNAVIQLVPDRWLEALGDGKVRSWAAGLGSALVVLELAELRRLRSLNKVLASTRMDRFAS